MRAAEAGPLPPGREQQGWKQCTATNMSEITQVSPRFTADPLNSYSFQVRSLPHGQIKDKQRFGERFLASEGNALLAQQMLPKQGELLAGQFISAPKVLPKVRMICMRWRRNTRGLVTYRTFSCSVRNGQVPSGTEQGLLRSSSCS